MAKRTQKYNFEELDKKSRDYLLTVRDRRGRGMPGLYIATPNYLPILGFVFGFIILIVLWLIAWNQIEQEPLGVAMLQTVGLLLGGWMIIAAVRTWVAARRDGHVGHFIYADAETLWECTGFTVTATDLINIIDSEAVTHYNKEGKYQHTEVTVFLKKGRRKLTLVTERKAERLTIFLNTLAWLRKGADSKKGGEDPSDLSAAVLGGIARENAREEYMPKTWTASALGVDVDEVPIPNRKNRPVFGLIPLLAIPVVGLLCIFLFSKLNVGLRDNAIWDRIGEINDHDARAPWLRAYLADARNTNHRDEAKQMLRSIYSGAVNRIRNSANPAAIEQPVLPNQGANAGTDKELVAGLEVLLLELAELPLPDVSISVTDKTGGPESAERAKQFRDNYARAVYEGVGEQLIRIAEAPPDTTGMINITIEHVRNVNAGLATITISFSKKPNDAAVKTVRRLVSVNDDSAASFAQVGNNLGLSTAGPAKPKPPPPPIDS
jgi:hypothetical protein